MRKQRAFITEIINSIKMASKGMVVRAEEPQEPTQDPATGGANPEQTSAPTQSSTINYEDLIAQARKQEKDKLYPQISKLQKENEDLVKKNNAHLLSIGEKDTEIRTLKAKIAELESNQTASASEKEKELQGTIDKLNKKIETMEKNTVSREDIEKEIKEEYEVKLYREQVLNQHKDEVIPELITGNTKEEIDASLEISKKRYSEITSKFNTPSQVEVPINNGGQAFNNASLNIEDIAHLDPRSPEYAQLRAKLGLR